jgi:hypothetical protein
MPMFDVTICLSQAVTISVAAATEEEARKLAWDEARSDDTLNWGSVSYDIIDVEELITKQ